MDFFARQDDARRASGLLVALFAGAALLAAVSLYAVLLAAAWVAGAALPPPFWWQPLLLAAALLLTAALLGGGATRALRRLRRQGGSFIAHRLGARPLRRDAPGENTLQNVVEEMAIAAGLPVPWIYVLENQPGLNALAAGHAPSDAVLIVTDGALARLSRDEIQSVVAHEFSHILHGDMRFNTRLLGLLDGLMMLPHTGAALLRAAFPKKADTGCMLRLGVAAILVLNALFFFAAGAPGPLQRLARVGQLTALVLAALVLVGGIGALAGRLLQRAVARRREFLADAAAVQFTRHPEGLRGALETAAALEARSRVLGISRLASTRHFFFADPQPPAFFERLLSSHPPLAKRLSALPPRVSDAPARPAVRSAPAENGQQAPPSGEAPFDPETGTKPPKDFRIAASPATLASMPTGDHLDYGHALHESLPAVLRQAVHDPLGAEALVYGLLLGGDAAGEARSRQQAFLEKHAGDQVREELRHLLPALAELPERARLPLVELLAPALRRLSAPQVRSFARAVRALVAADHSLSIFEFCLARLVQHWLRSSPRVDTASRSGSAIWDLRLAVPACEVLFSALASAGHPGDAGGARRAFATGMHDLADAHCGDEADDARFLEATFQTKVSPSRLGEALDRLASLTPDARRQVLGAGARCVLADGTATVTETELLRLVATLFECPLPPFLPRVT